MEALIMSRAVVVRHPIGVLSFRDLRKFVLCMSGAVVMVAVAGCTLDAPGKPTLSTTTSAEQTQRIFWQDVKDQKWLVVQGLLVPNVVWRNGSIALTNDQIVPALQQMQVKDFLITNVVVKANQDDMTVLYDLQLTTAASPQPVNYHAVAVWQEVPAPPDTASKQVKKEAQKQPPYLLTLEDLAGY
jgi:hypothetical protein